MAHERPRHSMSLRRAVGQLSCCSLGVLRRGVVRGCGLPWAAVGCYELAWQGRALSGRYARGQCAACSSALLSSLTRGPRLERGGIALLLWAGLDWTLQSTLHHAGSTGPPRPSKQRPPASSDAAIPGAQRATSIACRPSVTSPCMIS